MPCVQHIFNNQQLYSRSDVLLNLHILRFGITQYCIQYDNGKIEFWYDFELTKDSPFTRPTGRAVERLWSIFRRKHGDVIKWNHFPRYWPFVRGMHRSPVNSPHKCQWRRALMFSLICARTNGWANHRHAGDLIRHRAHYYVIVMKYRDMQSTYFEIQYETLIWTRFLYKTEHVLRNERKRRHHNVTSFLNSWKSCSVIDRNRLWCGISGIV